MEQSSANAFAYENGEESARVIVPLVLEYVSVKSIVDIGCGVGMWLSVFRDNGAIEVQGVDNDWVDRSRLVIPEASFSPRNLEEPFETGKSFDLAVSLETAEHLEISSAEGFIESIVKLAPVVLFSAAIPHQGGVHHVNEQWPAYWANIFKKHGYIPVDCIRRKIWNDDRVNFWFKQNTIIYVKESELSKYPKLQAEIESGNGFALALVHPYKYEYFAERWESIVPILGRIHPRLLSAGKAFLKKFKRNK